MGYRETDANLSSEQRVLRLEEAVAKGSSRRVYETLSIGIQGFLVLLGVGGLLFGGSFFAAALSDSSAQDTEDEIALLTATQDVQEVPITSARALCAEACSGIGMSIQRAVVVPGKDDSTHFRAASCSCVSEDGRVRSLWNDLVSDESRMRSECATACTSAGMGIQRAIIQDKSLVACGCVSPHGHRTLWDDRNPPTCAAVMEEDTLRCELTSPNFP